MKRNDFFFLSLWKFWLFEENDGILPWKFSVEEMMEFCHGTCLLRGMMYNFPSGIWRDAEQWWHFPWWNLHAQVMNGPLFPHGIFMPVQSWNSRHGILIPALMMEFPSLNFPANEDWWNVGICHGMCQHRETKSKREVGGESKASWNFHSSWRMMEWWNLP